MLGIDWYHIWWGLPLLSWLSTKPSIYTCVFYVLTIHQCQVGDVSYWQGDSNLPNLLCILSAFAFSWRIPIHYCDSRHLVTIRKGKRLFEYKLNSLSKGNLFSNYYKERVATLSSWVIKTSAVHFLRTLYAHEECHFVQTSNPMARGAWRRCLPSLLHVTL